jgi:hypothetical protein
MTADMTIFNNANMSVTATQAIKALRNVANKQQQCVVSSSYWMSRLYHASFLNARFLSDLLNMYVYESEMHL